MDTVKLSLEKKQDIIGKIQGYFWQEHELELGQLAASFILDFMIKELGKEFYNKGVEDAYTYMLDKLEDVMSIQKV